MGLFTKIFGTYSDRQLKRNAPIVRQIEDLADKYAAMTDAHKREAARFAVLPNTAADARQTKKAETEAEPEKKDSLPEDP